MSDKSGIEWTEATWNPIVGCKAVSPGCDHCYAARECSGRLAHLPLYAGLATNGVFTGEVRMVPERLDQPLRWKRPRKIFVNSMSDLFHADVPDQFIKQVFDVMGEARQHSFQVLTKRPQRMAKLLRSWQEKGFLFGDEGNEIGHWPASFYNGVSLPLANVWLGVSIESDSYAFRADHLRETPAAVRFLSLEPLLGALPSLDLAGIDWVIVGGESGPSARPMHPDWVREIRDRCIEAKVPFLFKQWGEWSEKMAEHPTLAQMNSVHWHPDGRGVGWAHHNEAIEMWRVGKKTAGRELDGRLWDQYPRAR